MARRNFATVDALFALACVVIFAGGVLAQTGAPGQSKPPRDEHQQHQPTDVQTKNHVQEKVLATALNLPSDRPIPVLGKDRPAPPPPGVDGGGNTGGKS